MAVLFIIYIPVEDPESPSVFRVDHTLDDSHISFKLDSNGSQPSAKPAQGDTEGNEVSQDEGPRAQDGNLDDETSIGDKLESNVSTASGDDVTQPVDEKSGLLESSKSASEKERIPETDAHSVSDAQLDEPVKGNSVKFRVEPVEEEGVTSKEEAKEEECQNVEESLERFTLEQVR